MDNKGAYPGTQPSNPTSALPPYVPAEPVATGPYGQPYGYGQPQAGYPSQPGYVAPQQQQPQVVVVGQQQQPAIVQQVQSYVAHIIFSCLVLWCCNWLFGLIAFILAGKYDIVSIFAARCYTHSVVLPRHIVRLCVCGVAVLWSYTGWAKK